MVGLNNVPVILADAVPLTPPVIPPVTVGAGHVKLVPTGMIPSVILVGVSANGNPLPVVLLMEVISATGFRLTVTVKASPAHAA